MPPRPSRGASWIWSISSPSWFDWKRAQLGARRPWPASARPRVDLGERGAPVDLGLAGAEQVQVRPVHHEDAERLRHAARTLEMLAQLRQMAPHQEARLAEVAVRARAPRTRKVSASTRAQQHPEARHAEARLLDGAAAERVGRLARLVEDAAELDAERRDLVADAPASPPKRAGSSLASTCSIAMPSLPISAAPMPPPHSSTMRPQRRCEVHRLVSPQVLEPALEGGDQLLAARVAERRGAASAPRGGELARAAPRPRRRAPGARAARRRSASRRARRPWSAGNDALGLVEIRGAQRARGHLVGVDASRRAAVSASAKAPSISSSPRASSGVGRRAAGGAQARRARAGDRARPRARARARPAPLRRGRGRGARGRGPRGRRRARGGAAGPRARRARPPRGDRPAGWPRRGPGRRARPDRRRAGPRGGRSRPSPSGPPWAPLPSPSPGRGARRCAPRAAGSPRGAAAACRPRRSPSAPRTGCARPASSYRRAGPRDKPCAGSREARSGGPPARGAPRGRSAVPSGAIPRASERRAAKTMPIATASPWRTPR